MRIPRSTRQDGRPRSTRTPARFGLCLLLSCLVPCSSGFSQADLPTEVFLEIPDAVVACAVYSLSSEARPDRGPKDELELKSQLLFRPGRVRLPTNVESFSADILEEVIFGRERDVLQPTAPGNFSVFRTVFEPDQVFFRFTFRQQFALPSGGTLTLETVDPLSLVFDSGKPVAATLLLDDEFLGAYNVLGLRFQGRLDDGSDIPYDICASDRFLAWETRVELDGGTSFRLLERTRGGACTVAAPAFLSRATAASSLGETTVESYWDLVFSARREQERPHYWMVLPQPVRFPGTAQAASVIELAPDIRCWEYEPESPEFVVRYLDAEFHEFARARSAPATRNPVQDHSFLLGDINADGRRNLDDVHGLLVAMFTRRTEMACALSGDLDRNARLTIADPILLAQGLFGNIEIGLDPGCETVHAAGSLNCADPVCRF